MISMMIIGSSMFHSGLSELIGARMAKHIGRSEQRAILVTMIASCALSSVCTNIGVMTALAPLCTAMCLSAGMAPSKVLLSLFFGAQLGGINTLVGVPSNVFANSLLTGAGYESFGLFSITPFGIVCCLAGALYFAFIGSRLLRDTGYVTEFARTDRKPLDKKKAAITVITLFSVLAVIAISPKALPMHLAAVIGALVIVGTGCMMVKETFSAVDWNCAFLMGSLSAMSAGLQNSGVGELVSGYILKLFGEHPSDFMVITVLFFVVAVMTQFISNTATILLFMPIAISVCGSPWAQCLSCRHDRHAGGCRFLWFSVRSAAEHAGSRLDQLQVHGFCQGRGADDYHHLHRSRCTDPCGHALLNGIHRMQNC